MIIEALRIIFGSIFVLFLPGFVLSWIFFPDKNEIDWIERAALAFGLSIAVVPLAVFYLNYLFGVKINIQNVAVIITTIIIIGYLGYLERTKKSMSRSLKQLKIKLKSKKITKKK